MAKIKSRIPRPKETSWTEVGNLTAIVLVGVFLVLTAFTSPPRLKSPEKIDNAKRMREKRSTSKRKPVIVRKVG